MFWNQKRYHALISTIHFSFTESSSLLSILPFSFYAVVQWTLRLLCTSNTRRPLKEEGSSNQPQPSLFKPTTSHKQLYADRFSTFWKHRHQPCTDRYVSLQYSRYVHCTRAKRLAVSSTSRDTSSDRLALQQPLQYVAWHSLFYRSLNDRQLHPLHIYALTLFGTCSSSTIHCPAK